MKMLSACKLPFAWIVSLSILASGVAPSRAQDISVQTPKSVTQCIPTTIQWSGGTGPYFLAITPPDSTVDNEQQFPGLTGNSFTWNTNVAGGTTLVLFLTDSEGGNGQSSSFVVGHGPDDSCLGSTGTSGLTSTSPIPTTSTTSPVTHSSTSSTQLVVTKAQNPPTHSPSSTSDAATRPPPTSSPTSTPSPTVTSSTSATMSSSLTTASEPGPTNSNVTSSPSASLTPGSYDTPFSTQDTASGSTYTLLPPAAHTESGSSPVTPTRSEIPQDAAHAPKLSTAAIVGVAVGGSVTIIALLVALLLWHRGRSAPSPTGSKSPIVADVPVFPPRPPLSPAKGARLHSARAPFSGTDSSRPEPGMQAISAEHHVPHGELSRVEDGSAHAAPPVGSRASPTVSRNRYSGLADLANSALPGITSPIRQSYNSAGVRSMRQSLAVARQPRYETDGGVRLAGGPLGAVADDDVLSDVHSTYPPPYDMY